MTIVRFLGSVYFAIALIVFTVLFVIAGTFLEAWSDSHLFAAHFIYQNPVFITLLWLYFVNILISTLLRYPFQRKHIPFIITHIGLLMLFGGALVRGYFGTQGVVSLIEGTGSSQILLPNTYALYIEQDDHVSVIPIHPKKGGALPSPIPNLSLAVVDWVPHVEEKQNGWIDQKNGHIFGFPPFPVFEWNQGPLPTSLKTSDYTITAIKSGDVDGIAKQLANSAIALVNTDGEEITLLAKNKEGELYQAPLDNELMVVIDRGYGGYGYAANLPPNFPPVDLITPLFRQIIKKPLPRKKEEATPSLSLLVSTPDQAEVIRLTYDRYGQNLKWPGPGHTLLRFQPQIKQLPNHIRLKKALQINYPHTNQPFSYESELWIDDKEVTISMNHVHQTAEGFRFYMAGLTHRPYAKAAQIVVNHNPGKNYLTYPGAIILTIGMLLLYLKKVYA
ncbi:MAG: hypothetical protein S4CHLAM45_09230 [Chlamydiales bacterium]|nr:hypothetical protein [Chlamydiales bacterium]MCH9620524.1 hypothetical protein [Chlamydiales bacterium]MCH9623027.1 hypothetical protein [Chlamydiales bacterium]